MPDFDEIARFNLKQCLAFTYIRLGDGVTAEQLARELIAAYSCTTALDSPYVLRIGLNLAQAFMIERKFHESVQEADAIYPAFLAKFGADHQLTMQLLTTRAQSEGSLGLYEDSVRDDLAIYGVSVKKQGLWPFIRPQRFPMRRLRNAAPIISSKANSMRAKRTMRPPRLLDHARLWGKEPCFLWRTCRGNSACLFPCRCGRVPKAQDV